jgi:hypothetical protein
MTLRKRRNGLFTLMLSCMVDKLGSAGTKTVKTDPNPAGPTPEFHGTPVTSLFPFHVIVKQMSRQGHE